MKTLQLFIMGIIVITGIILGNQISLVHAELSNPLAPPSNEECAKKITDSENMQSLSYDEKKAIDLATNSPELKNRPVGYQYVFDSVYKHFDVDTHACNAVWRYVNVVFDLKDPQGNILSQITLTEDAQLTRVIAASMQQYSPPTVQMTSPNAAHMTPQRGLDSKIALVMLFGIISGTALLVIYFSRRSKGMIPKGVAAARIFFAVFSMMLLSVIIFLPFNIIHHDSADEQIFNAIGSIFYLIDYPITYMTSSVLEHFGITHGPLENIIGNYTVVIVFGIASVIATYGIWTRRYWSWKMCVGIMFVQLGLSIFSLQGTSVIILLFIPVLVILGLFSLGVKNYFRREIR